MKKSKLSNACIKLSKRYCCTLSYTLYKS